MPRPWLAIVLLAVVAAVCASLGFWQLGRAGQSRAAAERYAAALERPASRLRTADGANEELRDPRVTTTGRYVPGRQFLLDNIVRGGVVGYYVLTPFEPDGGGPWLIVNRGWVPAGTDRTVLPDVAVDAQPRRIDGVLDRLPSPGLRLGEAQTDASDEPLLVLTFPSIEELEAVLGERLFGYSLRLDPESPDGFARDFPAPGLTPERHLSYAVQWWLFGSIAGGAALVIGARVLRRRS